MTANAFACRVSSYNPFETLAYEHVASLGLKHVEILVPPRDKLDATRGLLERHGLTASTMHAECDVTQADLPARIEEQMPAFKALGTKIMFVAVKAGDTPLDQVYERMRAAGDVAAGHGITIAMETHPDLITNAEVTLRTMQAIDHPHVRVNFDTANVYFYNQGIDGVEQLRQIVRWVAAVHLKETDGRYRHWHFPALGRGIVDFPETFRVLDEAGFDGPCTLEIEGFDRETRTERMVCDRIAESVGFLRGIGRL